MSTPYAIYFVGETVLHIAAINGDYQVAKSSIDRGASVHERDYCGWQPLHEACNYGNLSIVELLLDRGADINDPGGPDCGGMTPLHDATQNGHVEIVKLLIARGASVSQSNKDGHTPLDLVMHFIDNDDDDVIDDDDALDVEVAKVRELARILRNAMKLGKRQSDKVSELRRRDRTELSDDIDGELSQDFSEVISIKPGKNSRKRKNVVLDLDSGDEENSPRDSINFNVAKTSENINSDSLRDDENQRKRKRSENILRLHCDSGSSCNTSSSSRVRTISNLSPTGTQSTRVAETLEGHRTNNGAKRQSRVNGRLSPSEPERTSSLTSGHGATTIPEAPMRLRVKVEDEIFLIPCPIVPGERKTVQWIAEQVWSFLFNPATLLRSHTNLVLPLHDAHKTTHTQKRRILHYQTIAY